MNIKTKVIKRNGNKSDFEKRLIVNAVASAQESIGDKAIIGYVIADKVEEMFSGRDTVSIFEIQDAVESELLEYNPIVATAYMQYRKQQDLSREKASELYSDIEGLVKQSNESILNENANKDAKVIPTQRDLLAGIVAKHYARNHLLPSDVVEAHDKGDIHYHDLDYAPFFPMFNCMIVDLENMLNNGFKMGNAEIETPKSIYTAVAVVSQIITQVASHTYGGTTINRLDEILSKYVTMSYEKHLVIARDWGIANAKGYAKERTEVEVHDAFQSLEYEANTAFSTNGQTPFVTINFGLGASWENRLIQKEILINRMAGLGKKSKTAVFPKLVFTIKDGLNLNEKDPNYDIKKLALECASKRMYPDILNYDKIVEVTGSFKSPMGCRSFLDNYKDESGNEVHEGRNNLGVVSLNLPRIALESKGSEETFFELLDERLTLACKALMTRIDRLRGVKASVAPILYTEGALGVRMNPDDEILDLFKNGRASISLGYIGIHETVNALYGSSEHIFENKDLQEKAIAIVQKLKDSVDAWKKETGWGFSLYSTPSENLCSRFCKLDKEVFGEKDGVTDKGYYTNSFHLDVQKKVNPYDKIDFEKAYPAITSGGFICYGEFPNMKNNLEALENVWDYSYHNVPYYGTNTPIDECYECGYEGEFDCTSKGFTCPKCGNHESSKMSVTRRVCGYLGSPDARPFNDGKQDEVEKRVKHL